MTTLRAVTSFAGPDRRHIAEGTVIDSTDPIVRGREALFEPVEAAAARQVEQATAAPGERRSVSRPAKKAAPKSDD